MFTRKEESQPAQTNRVMQGMKFAGDVEIQGDIRIDGTIIGMVRVEGKMVLGETGIIEGDVACESCDLSGTITGTVVVEELTKLRETALLNGDLFTGMLESQAGAEMYGKMSLGNEWKKELENELETELENGPEEVSATPSEEENTSTGATSGEKPKRKYTKRSQGSKGSKDKSEGSE